MDQKIVFQTQLQLNTPTKRQTLNGIEYIVAPAVILVEGVHNGSGGPIYHPAEEMANYPQRWDGVPVVIDHPYFEDGTPRSANDPQVLEKQGVGQLFNTRYDAQEKKLKSEVWIDIKKAQKIAPEIIGMIENGKLEVSTGMVTDVDETPGVWNEEKYDSIAKNIIPDHLALLPDSIGACSWKDGCGIRVNKAFENGREIVKEVIRSITNTTRRFISRNFLTNKESFEDIERRIHEAINTPVPQRWEDEKWIRATYDNEFIYESYSDGKWRLFKRGYSINGDGNVELGNDIFEVKESLSYTVISQLKQNKEDVKMDKGKDCCKEVIDALIANKLTQWTEEHRGVLEELPEDILKNMAPVENEIPDDGGKEEDDKIMDKVETKPEEEQTNLEETPAPTAAEYIAQAPPEIRDFLTRSLKDVEVHKASLIKTIVEHEKNTFTEEQLKAKNVDELKALVQFIGNAAPASQGHFGMGYGQAPQMFTQEESGPGKMPEVDWTKNKTVQ